MSKAKELQTTTELVREVLQRHPKARNSDNELYYWVCAIIGHRNGIDVHKMSMPMFFLHLHECGFPQFETVRRTRQKLQATYPELSGSAEVTEQRKEHEEAFREYARGNA